MRIGRWKIRVNKLGLPIIGDLVADPDEHEELSTKKPVERRMLTDHLGTFLAVRHLWDKTTWGVITNLSAAGAVALDQVTTP